MRDAASRGVAFKEINVTRGGADNSLLKTLLQQKYFEEIQNAKEVSKLLNNAADTWRSYNLDANKTYNDLMTKYYIRKKQVGHEGAYLELANSLRILKGIETSGKYMEEEIGKLLRTNFQKKEGTFYMLDRNSLNQWIEEYRNFGYNSPDATEEEKETAYNAVITPEIKALYGLKDGEVPPEMKWALDLKMKEMRFYNRAPNFYTLFDINGYINSLSQKYKDKQIIQEEPDIVGQFIESKREISSMSKENAEKFYAEYMKNNDVWLFAVNNLLREGNNRTPIRDLNEVGQYLKAGDNGKYYVEYNGKTISSDEIKQEMERYLPEVVKSEIKTISHFGSNKDSSVSDNAQSTLEESNITFAIATFQPETNPDGTKNPKAGDLMNIDKYQTNGWVLNKFDPIKVFATEINPTSLTNGKKPIQAKGTSVDFMPESLFISYTPKTDIKIRNGNRILKFSPSVPVPPPTFLDNGNVKILDQEFTLNEFKSKFRKAMFINGKVVEKTSSSEKAGAGGVPIGESYEAKYSGYLIVTNEVRKKLKLASKKAAKVISKIFEDFDTGTNEYGDEYGSYNENNLKKNVYQ